MKRPTTVADTLATAFAHLDGGRIEEARRLARMLSKQTPEPPGLAYLDGLIALADKDGTKAARHIARALKQTPDATPLVLAMARAQALQGRDAEAEEHYRRLVQAEPKATAGRVELAALLTKRGIAQREAGATAMAAALFGEAASFDPSSALTHFLLGQAREVLGTREQAVEAYRRALALDPTDRYGAALALARLGGAPAPGKAPDAFVRDLFDQYADRFDTALVETLHYRAPELLVEAIRRTLGPGPFDIYDAGCGTGLMGEALKPMARRLAGSDLSARMVEKARARGVYDELATGDMVALLGVAPGSYDLVTAADVLVYIGDLADVFAAAGRALRASGGFAFTVERGSGEGWNLGESGRYAHGAAYLRKLAAAHGFAVAALDEASTREDRGQPVPGLVCVLRKDS
jgi:predicted TPR repeat methyltransferase